MRPVAERQVLVGIGSVDAELVGGLEDALVAVGRRGAHDQPLAVVHRTAAHVGVGDAAPHDEHHRGPQPQALFDGGVQRRRAFADSGLQARHRQRVVDEVAEQLARRRQSAGDEVADERAQLSRREVIAVDFEPDEAGEHFVRVLVAAGAQLGGALGDLVVDVAGEVGNALAKPSPRWDRLVAGKPLSINSLAHAAIVSASSAGNPRRWTVTRFGQRDGERGHEIGLPAVGDLRKEALSGGLDEVLGRVHHLGRERGDHHPAHRRVLRRIHLAQDAILGLHDDARGLEPTSIGKRRRVAQHGAAFLEPGDVLHPIGEGRDRRLAAQLREQWPRRLHLVCVERVERLRHTSGDATESVDANPRRVP